MSYEEKFAKAVMGILSLFAVNKTNVIEMMKIQKIIIIKTWPLEQIHH